jgi:hypothetical protein
MAVLDPKETHRNLLKKGFVNAPGDHKRLEYYYNDKLILHTKISHGTKEIGDYLIKQMYVQCQLSKGEFIDLAKCPLSKEEYFNILKDKGII